MWRSISSSAFAKAIRSRRRFGGRRSPSARRVVRTPRPSGRRNVRSRNPLSPFPLRQTSYRPTRAPGPRCGDDSAKPAPSPRAGTWAVRSGLKPICTGRPNYTGAPHAPDEIMKLLARGRSRGIEPIQGRRVATATRQRSSRIPRGRPDQRAGCRRRGRSRSSSRRARAGCGTGPSAAIASRARRR